MDPEDALKFINYFAKKENYSKFNKNRTPIIEFSIEDIRKIRKFEKILASKKKERKASEKDNKKKEEINKKSHTYKVLIEEILQKKDPNNLPEVKNYLQQIKSRGIKQRLKKRIEADFGIKLYEEKPKVIKTKTEEKKEKFKEKAKVLPTKKISNDNENDAYNDNEIKKIVKKQKEKTKLKRKAEDNDEFDVNYI